MQIGSLRMDIAYIDSELLSESDKEHISSLVEAKKVFRDFFTVDIDSTIKAEYLCCFSDSDILRAVRSSIQYEHIFVVELPGDHSFFADIRFEQLEDLEQLLMSSYTERRHMVRVEFDQEEFNALNDVYLSSSTPNTRIRYDLLVDDHSVFDNLDSANGILVSTPTGSTAMSMNLGGAYVHPTAEIFQFQAIASRNHFARSQIISDKSTLEIDITDAIYPLFVQIDNLRRTTESNHFTISKSDEILNLLRFDVDDRPQTIENKLQTKISFEDTSDLTSSAKFILHVLQNKERALTIAEIMDETHLRNDKTVRSSLKLLIAKGFVRRKDNLQDLREHLYYFVDPALSRYYQD